MIASMPELAATLLVWRPIARGGQSARRRAPLSQEPHPGERASAGVRQRHQATDPTPARKRISNPTRGDIRVIWQALDSSSQAPGSRYSVPSLTSVGGAWMSPSVLENPRTLETPHEAPA